ncbi:lipid IV(A) 3-deoxy-D-manno-octulosonic acid transferase [Aestuariibacter sp. A3R04]|uniref:lipid IV(A) 3-deoxy-D-manno-octulosonic acid transferase n=1 Tax=Aestuariibacter sp. A3R04 TaxID=2841571 RepID=UPI001C09A59B|nr:lipid IV(A) 3-deoxy-D-manno-octulosonic acid transferase [Aestuariibacter sp. A3R04]MBU3020750.1 lipid IV(A) 3-deoxy-D-manno-octulosonic acid transferase [Aestuariibacter sp. A3R04]
MKDITDGWKPSLAENAFRWLYSFLLALVIPFAFANLVIRGNKRNSEYNRRRFERFGFVLPPKAPHGYLFHCVSVGEVVAASVLIKKIMREEPDTAITITTTTPTGSARVRDIFKDAVHHFYLPYDLHMAMAGMLRRVKPKMVVITEVELWPNLIHSCWRRQIPVVVANARMTTRSAKRYKKVSLLFSPMLHKIDHVCAQGKRDYDNYLYLGIAERKLTLTNNIKFDQASNVEGLPPVSWGLTKGTRPVIIGGSTHDGEEVALLTCYQHLQSTYPSLLLILVPRHPERFNAVKQLLINTGIKLVCSSSGQCVDKNTQVFLIDEMGKLNHAYGLADIAFVGGSLAERGGHNALEPAARQLPIIMGPHTYNNPVICQYLQEKGALVIVHDQQTLTRQCDMWLKNPQSAKSAGEAGYAVLQANRGAVNTTAEIMRMSSGCTTNGRRDDKLH